MEGFCLAHSRVEWVSEEHFRRIKESAFLDSWMPPSLVWMEEPVNGCRRYFSHSAQRVALDESLMPGAWELVGKLVAEVDHIYFADFYNFYLDNSVLCLSPTSFQFGTCKEYAVFSKMVTPSPLVLNAEDLAEARILAERDINYIFDSASPPARKYSKQTENMRRFGWIKDNGEVDFDRLRPEFESYCNRVDDVLRALHDKLSEMSGKVILNKSDANDTSYRDQYSMDPAIIAQEYGLDQSSSEEEESF